MCCGWEERLEAALQHGGQQVDSCGGGHGGCGQWRRHLMRTRWVSSALCPPPSPSLPRTAVVARRRCSSLAHPSRRPLGCVAGRHAAAELCTALQHSTSSPVLCPFTSTLSPPHPPSQRRLTELRASPLCATTSLGEAGFGCVGTAVAERADSQLNAQSMGSARVNPPLPLHCGLCAGKRRCRVLRVQLHPYVRVLTPSHPSQIQCASVYCAHRDAVVHTICTSTALIDPTPSLPCVRGRSGLTSFLPPCYS